MTPRRVATMTMRWTSNIFRLSGTVPLSERNRDQGPGPATAQALFAFVGRVSVSRPPWGVRTRHSGPASAYFLGSCVSERSARGAHRNRIAMGRTFCL